MKLESARESVIFAADCQVGSALFDESAGAFYVSVDGFFGCKVVNQFSVGFDVCRAGNVAVAAILFMEYECSVVDLDVTCVIFVYTADVEDSVAVFLEVPLPASPLRMFTFPSAFTVSPFVV